MGPCTSLQATKRPPVAPPASLTGSQWQPLLRYNFDTPDFKFAKSLQDQLPDEDGAFLQPHRVAALVLELKRFLYLLL